MKKLAFALVFVAGAAIGFVASGLNSGKQAQAPAAEEAVEAEKKDGASRIEELERELAAARAEIAHLGKLNEEAEKAVAQALEEKPPQLPRPPAFEFGTNVDINAEMKKNLSEDQFDAVTNAIAGFRAKLAARAKGRIDFLSSIDVSKLSAGDRENHNKYVDLLKRREELMGKNKGGFPDFDTIRQMTEIQMQMGPLAKKERSMLVNEMAHDLGYQGDDAEVVRDTINNIYDCTSGGGLMGNLEDAMEVMGGGQNGGPVSIGVSTDAFVAPGAVPPPPGK